jgi:hypothetical protein
VVLHGEQSFDKLKGCYDGGGGQMDKSKGSVIVVIGRPESWDGKY